MEEQYVYSLIQVTHTRLMLLHDSRNDDGIKSFFQEVHELYIKVTFMKSIFFLKYYKGCNYLMLNGSFR